MIGEHSLASRVQVGLFASLYVPLSIGRPAEVVIAISATATALNP